MFIEWGRPTFSIVKVEVDGNVYVGDACNYFKNIDYAIFKNMQMI